MCWFSQEIQDLEAARKRDRWAGNTGPEDLARAELYDAASVHFSVGTPPFTPGYARSVIGAGIAAGKRKPRPLATPGAAA